MAFPQRIPGPKGEPLPPPFVSQYPSITDQQAPLIAYTVNEAICGRNKWVKGGADGTTPINRTYRFVHLAEIQGAGTTILATEFTQNPLLISSDNGTDSASSNLKTHRPVSAFTTISGSGDEGDLFGAAPGGFKSAGFGLQRTRPGTPQYTALQNNKSEADYGGSRLAWVGRNHGTGSFQTKKTNFVYVDGHVEYKTIFNSLTPGFEWGDQVYSLSPGSDFQH